jgi:hypothetical protein
MKKQHTPGPWSVAFGNRLEIHGPKDEIGWPKVIVYNAGLCTDKESKANAALLAAAPDMLAALQSLILEFSHYATGSEDENEMEAMTHARNLYKEITGKEI